MQARWNFDQHKNISPVKHLIIKTFNPRGSTILSRLNPIFQTFSGSGKGPISRLFQELKTRYELCQFYKYNLLVGGIRPSVEENEEVASKL